MVTRVRGDGVDVLMPSVNDPHFDGGCRFDEDELVEDGVNAPARNYSICGACTPTAVAALPSRAPPIQLTPTMIG
jgi:hypothetical protein